MEDEGNGSICPIRTQTEEEKNNDRTATAALLSAVYRNGKNRCDRRCCQWTVLLIPKEVQDRANRTGTDRPQYDEPETENAL